MPALRADPRQCDESPRFHPDGTHPQIYATGVRNPFGLAVRPANRKLYATDNGRDDFGDAVPDELNLIVQHGRYGWPDCWGRHQGSKCGGRSLRSLYFHPILPLMAWPSTRVRGSAKRTREMRLSQSSVMKLTVSAPVTSCNSCTSAPKVQRSARLPVASLTRSPSLSRQIGPCWSPTLAQVLWEDFSVNSRRTQTRAYIAVKRRRPGDRPH